MPTTNTPLSPREEQVLALIARGRSNTEIATELGISFNTVKAHVEHILAKLGVDSREEAARWWDDQRMAPQPSVFARWVRALGHLPWPRIGVAAGLGTLAVGAVALAALVLLALPDDDEPADAVTPDTPTSNPATAAPGAIETPQQLLQQMGDRLAGDGRILRIESDWRTVDDGEELLGTFEAWFDFSEDQFRIEYRKGPDNDTDTSEFRTEWYDGEYIYELGPDDDRPRRGLVSEQHRTCFDAENYMTAVLACGLDRAAGNSDVTNVHLADPGEWNGQSSLVLAYEWNQLVDPPGRPPEPPTPTPAAPEASPSPSADSYMLRRSYEFHVAPETLIPLGWRITSEREDTGATSTRVKDYAPELLDRDAVDLALFDPRAEGFLTEDEIQTEMLDNPVDDAPVYWLGHEYDAGPDVGTLVLEGVDQRYVPVERPSLITLRYGKGDPTGGRVAIEIWTVEGWQGFLDMLSEHSAEQGGGFVFAEPCGEIEDITIDTHPARLFKGIDIQPGMGALATPTPTPLPDAACPPQSTYAVEVRFDGYVATLNAPLGLFSNGGPYEAFDSPEALLAIAEGLRLRQPGE